MPDPESDQSNNDERPLVRLRKEMSTTFNEEELKLLCSDLGVDFENLPGEIKERKIDELIKLTRRKKHLPELINVITKLRPESHWPTLKELAKQENTSVTPPKKKQGFKFLLRYGNFRLKLTFLIPIVFALSILLSSKNENLVRYQTTLIALLVPETVTPTQDVEMIAIALTLTNHAAISMYETEIALTVTPSPSPTTTPTHILVFTDTPTLVPPTNTPIRPTGTAVPPTNTAPPFPVTHTAVPPTNTPRPFVPTNTPVPPTNTASPFPVTYTAVPPTNTPYIRPTNTSTGALGNHLPSLTIPAASTVIVPTTLPPTPAILVPTPTPPPPPSGSSNVILYIGIALMISSALVAIITRLRRDNDINS